MDQRREAKLDNEENRLSIKLRAILFHKVTILSRDEIIKEESKIQ